MTSSVRCKSPSSSRRRYMRAPYTSGHGVVTTTRTIGETRRAPSIAVNGRMPNRRTSISTSATARSGHPLDGEVAGQLAPVQRERTSHRVALHFAGGEGDLGEVVRLQHLARAAAL